MKFFNKSIKNKSEFYIILLFMSSYFHSLFSPNERDQHDFKFEKIREERKGKKKKKKSKSFNEILKIRTDLANREST